ncbi:protovillin [Tieghemostelium lacteum]|uniref:Protovillin n=1 Tax=Tieghemostelium lacteum TaxID=361077 RepID=A0A151Z4U7_TIELA|nr:protovillin [Tieghemostelium lacteum]|eukprot:KYQ88824.1 protovillin [Tieghemostelium lacteum]
MEPEIIVTPDLSSSDNGTNTTGTIKTRKIPSKFSIHQKRNEMIQKENAFQLSSSFSHVNEIGKEIGLEIWKVVDNDTIQKVPKINHGIFETNKSYLLLMGKFGTDEMTSKDYSIHFWIGELLMNDNDQITFCNQKMEELEFIVNKYQQIHSAPILYREFQGREGDIFMSFFKNQGGPRYVPPLKLTKTSGPSSGSSDVMSKLKLYHLKGRRNVRVKQVELSAKSLNSGDVFVLDGEDIIYQWNGKEASRIEKGKGLDLTVRLRDEKSAKAKIVVFDEPDQSEHPDFFKRLGGTAADIQQAESAGDDVDYEKKSLTAIKLYQVQNESSPDSQDQTSNSVNLNIIEPQGEAFNVSQLESMFCYIMDCETELFVWSGKETSMETRSLAYASALDLMHDDKKPVWTPVTKMTQGSENTLFKDKFKKGTWGEFKETYDKKVTGKIAQQQKQEKINVDQLHNPDKYKLAKEEIKSTIPTLDHVDDFNSGDLKVWVVRDKKNFELPQSEYGIFYTQSCYLVQFTLVSQDGTHRSILYYWQGRFSSQEDRGLSALLAKDISSNLKGCIQVRTVQNKEPLHFLQHFKNKMVVFRGARENTDSPVFNFSGLYHVRGTNEYNIHAIQVEQKIESLDSNDSFILVNGDKSYIWGGKFSNEKEVATLLAQNILKQQGSVYMEEGQEPDEFWTVLQPDFKEKKYYQLERSIEQELKTRLFQCSNNSGVFKVFEIFDFSQDDLDQDDVMILDTGREIFVWIGKDSNDVEKSMSMETALEYVQAAPQSRKDDPIYRIESSEEPIQFTSCFHAWDVQKVGQDSYKTKLEKLLKGQPGLPMVMPPMTPGAGIPKLKPSTSKPVATTPPVSTPTPSIPKLKPVSLKPVATTTTPTPTTASTKPVSPRNSVTLTPPISTSGRPLSPRSSTTVTRPVSPTPPPVSANVVPGKVYPISRLKQKPLPEDVDTSNLQNHISDEDFLTLFKVSKKDFGALPAWKQLNLKKSTGLF